MPWVATRLQSLMCLLRAQSLCFRVRTRSWQIMRAKLYGRLLQGYPIC